MNFSQLFLIFCAFFISLTYTNMGMCSLVLTEGESYTFEFTSLPYESEFYEGYFDYISIIASPASSIPSTYTAYCYENSITEDPISITQGGLDPNFGSTVSGRLIETISAPWKDLQGIIFIEITKGAIEFESIRAATVIGDTLYRQTLPVPIPSSCIITLSGFFLIVFVRRVKKANQNL